MLRSLGLTPGDRKDWDNLLMLMLVRNTVALDRLSILKKTHVLGLILEIETAKIV
jgi:hypothetical protein